MIARSALSPRRDAGRLPAAVGLMVALLLGAAALGGAAPAQAQAPPDRAAVLERFRTAVVRVEVEGRAADGKVARPRLGTGVIVGADGLIVTAGHMIGRDEEWAETARVAGCATTR